MVHLGKVEIGPSPSGAPMPEETRGPCPVPREVAARPCSEHRGEHPVGPLSQCWGCLKASKGDETKMCYHRPPGFRGCAIVDRGSDGPPRPGRPPPTNASS